MAGPVTSQQRSAAGFRRLLGLLSGAVIAAGGCTSTSDSLGYDDLLVGLDGGSGGLAGSSGTGGTDNPEGGNGADDAGGSDGMGDPGGNDGGGSGGGSGRGGSAGDGGSGGKGLVAGTSGGGSSGSGGAGSGGAGGAGGDMKPTTLIPLDRRSAYPNPIRDDLGVSEEDIEAHIDEVYEQLFHSTAEDEPIFYVVPEDESQAYIKDILHGDVRTEGLGLGMLISVQLDHQDDFDRLWTYSKKRHLIPQGESYSAGYFNSICDTSATTKAACIDPYGMQQFAMSLIFAHGRWGSDGEIDYEADALELLDVMLHKEERNGPNFPEGVTNVFDDRSKLVFDEPNINAISYTRPSIEMPAYYELWYQATNVSFWSYAAREARNFFGRAVDETTGLFPQRAYFSTGDPVMGSENYGTEAYRVMMNITLDQIWTGEDPWRVDECNKVVDFFLGLPADPGTTFTLAGEVVDAAPEKALLLVNGITAVCADTDADPNRREFIRQVWEFPTPKAEVRYYHGLLQLYALLVMTGRMQIW
ncbi:MAG TPA: glycosyl hydrolase family 8 [Polyangiaceae bacterium]